MRIGMIVVGTAAAGWLIGIVTGSLSSFGEVSQGVFFIIFSLCAIAAAIRMVTHERPIYCALHFVLVVISSAGLLLLLEAEFMAFALIIVYAGAILITYIFVLMLASQADEPNNPETQAVYDRIPREPAAAVSVGFLLLCLITGTVIGGTPSLPVTEESIHKWHILEKLPKKLESNILELDSNFAFPVIETEGSSIQFSEQGVFVVSSEGKKLFLDEDALPTNTQMVGWSLVNDFPISLELAGVILLMAMFGAAILARRAIDLTEQKKSLTLGNDEDGGQT
jgi:NADH-quinone oxidoreductase subunit J